jgi:hypothetical protein
LLPFSYRYSQFHFSPIGNSARHLARPETGRHSGGKMPKQYTDLTADELAEVHNISVAAAQEIIDARPIAEAKRAEKAAR